MNKYFFIDMTDKLCYRAFAHKTFDIIFMIKMKKLEVQV